MDTLADKIVTTLGEHSILIATDDEANEIADLADTLGPDTTSGLINWFLSRHEDDFVQAAALIAALRAGLAARTLEPA